MARTTCPRGGARLLFTAHLSHAHSGPLSLPPWVHACTGRWKGRGLRVWRPSSRLAHLRAGRCCWPTSHPQLAHGEHRTGAGQQTSPVGLHTGRHLCKIPSCARRADPGGLSPRPLPMRSPRPRHSPHTAPGSSSSQGICFRIGWWPRHNRAPFSSSSWLGDREARCFPSGRLCSNRRRPCHLAVASLKLDCTSSTVCSE